MPKLQLHVSYVGYRLGRKTPDGKIIVCPRCGQRGAMRIYSNGSGGVVHEKEYRNSPFPHWTLEGDMFHDLPRPAEVSHA